ncbi:unnamed protein product, partial [Discosporangium mesarthrocarpum]
MHDEAAAHYVGMVDQTHLGHTFLRREFGEAAVPTVGWQIDPFGHSATQAALLSAQVGFEALYFGRIHFKDRARRIAAKDMEFIWRASPSLGEEGQVFTAGVFHSGNYGPPVGYCFDSACADDPMMEGGGTGSGGEDGNVRERVDGFVRAVEELGRHTAGSDVMLQMGGDFGFEEAEAWFLNLDRLLDAVNLDRRVEAFYSTPANYTLAKHRSGLDWSVKEDDFFPYADCKVRVWVGIRVGVRVGVRDCYWTGYFTSRPGLKRLERVTSAYLQSARQLVALVGTGGVGQGEDGSRLRKLRAESSLAMLERAQALVQHHDGVSGTSKQHVASDYAKRLDVGRVAAERIVNKALAILAHAHNEQVRLGAGAGAGAGAEISPMLIPIPPTYPEYHQCRLANVSICEVTQE